MPFSLGLITSERSFLVLDAIILLLLLLSSSSSIFLIFVVPVLPMIISPPLTFIPGNIIPSLSNLPYLTTFFLSGISNFSSPNFCSEIYVLKKADLNRPRSIEL